MTRLRSSTRRRSVPLRYQLSATECGAACLAMVAGFYGRQTLVSECRDLLGSGRDGVSATRLAEYVQDMDKVYRTTVLLGARSDTDDADGAIVAVDDVTVPSLTAVQRAVNGFVGDIDQVPPAYSE